jgi:hypothetical protein
MAERKVTKQYKKEAQEARGGTAAQQLSRKAVGVSHDWVDAASLKSQDIAQQSADKIQTIATDKKNTALKKSGLADTKFSGDWQQLHAQDDVGEEPLDRESKEWKEWEKRKKKKERLAESAKRQAEKERRKAHREENKLRKKMGLEKLEYEEEVVEAPKEEEVEAPKVRPLDYEQSKRLDSLSKTERFSADRERERQMAAEAEAQAVAEAEAAAQAELEAAAAADAAEEAEHARVAQEEADMAKREKKPGMAKRAATAPGKGVKSVTKGVTSGTSTAIKSSVSGVGTVTKDVGKAALKELGPAESKADRKERKRQELLERKRLRELAKKPKKDTRSLQEKLAETMEDDFGEKEQALKEEERVRQEAQKQLDEMDRKKKGGVAKRLVSAPVSIVTKTTKAAVAASTTAVTSSSLVAVQAVAATASSAVMTTSRDMSEKVSYSSEEEDEVPEGSLRDDPKFHAYFEKKIDSGMYAFDLLDPTNYEMTAEAVNQSLMEYENEVRKIKAAEKEARKLDRQEHAEFDGTKKGKALAQQEKDLEAASFLAEAKREQLRLAAEKAHLEATQAEEALRMEHMRIDMCQPARELQAKHDAQAELKMREEEFSLWAEFAKDPYDPEGQYLEYLCKLDRKSPEYILDFWARMRKKEGMVVEDDGNGASDEEDSDMDDTHAETMVSVVNTRIRSGFEMDSPEIGIMEVGEEIVPLEHRKNENEIMRIRFEKNEFVEDEDGSGNGEMVTTECWVSYTSSQGQAILEIVPPPKKEPKRQLTKKEKKKLKRKMKRTKKAEKKAKKKAKKNKGDDDDEEQEDEFADLEPPKPDPEMIAAATREIPVAPTLHYNSQMKFTTDDEGSMEVIFADETVVVPGGSLGAVRIQMEEVTVEGLTLKKEVFPQVPMQIPPAWMAAQECMAAAVKAEREAEAEREKVRSIKAKKEAQREAQAKAKQDEKTRKEDERRRREEEKQENADRLKAKEAEKRKKQELKELKQMQKGWEKARDKVATDDGHIRSPYEVLTELKEHCERYTEDFPLAWDRFVDVFHANRENVVIDMQRSLQVCRLLPKLADRKKKLQHDMVESLIAYEHDVSLAKFEGVQLATEFEREDKIINVVDEYLQALGKFERKRFSALVKDGDMLLARRMATR